MTILSTDILDIHLEHQVHSGLTIDVSLRLGREIGVIFGPSGAGKTTLLRLIAGLASPRSGHVRLDGVTLCDIAGRIRVPLRRRRIGMIFQDDCLFPHLNVAANIRFGLNGWPRDEAANRAAHVAALCNIEPLLTRLPATLSGGERQRVGLARALAPRPRLLLCDEPVSALDLTNRQAMIDRIREIQTAEGLPILYVTHSPAEAIALGSRLYLLEHGRIVSEGKPRDVLSAVRSDSPGAITWDGVMNVFRARVIARSSEQRTSRVQLDGGPVLVVPFIDCDEGTAVVVEIRGDDILLARAPIGRLSAQNQITATVERVIAHGPDAEAVMRTGGLTWVVSLVAEAVAQLEIAPGSELQLLVKARSCRVIVPNAQFLSNV